MKLLSRRMRNRDEKRTGDWFMTRNPKIWLAVLSVPLLLSVAPLRSLADPVSAGGPPGLNSAKEGGPQGRAQRIMQQVGLSPEQMQELKTLREQGRSQAQTLRQQLRAKQQELMRYIKSPGANEGQAMSLLGEINALQRQVGELRIKTWFRMRSHLTPEQMEKLQQMHQPHSRRGPGGHRGGFHQ
jgi:Spy/CpxP family protein refolding chaperone